jgi:glutaredoxin
LKKIVLITGADCPLCEEAKEILNSLQLKDVTLIEKDVYKTREIHNKYWDKIPVLVKAKQDLCWPFSYQEVKEFILI